MSNKFVQLHILTSYAPSNLNRDDLGRPKTAVYGGFNRLRISSQSLKRAWRTSDIFEQSLGDIMGVRTRNYGDKIYASLVAKLGEVKAKKIASSIMGVFGKVSKEAKDAKDANGIVKLDQIIFLSKQEQDKIDALCESIIETKKEPSEEELKELCSKTTSVDIALFGRMLTSAPLYNVEASCQVAHAISVHSNIIEDDFFTAVDDLNQGGQSEQQGSGFMGETYFSAAIFYQYICIDKELLIENLSGDKDLANKAIKAICETALKVGPSGKQNSFASRSYASYALVETGDEQPRSLSVAFLQPIGGDNILDKSIAALETQKKKFDSVFGQSSSSYVLNVQEQQGNLEELVKFAVAD